jgi:hypothetical protein
MREVKRCPRPGVHLRGSRAGIVLRSIKSAMACAGMRTARPQFTRGSLRRDTQARIVETFKPSASAACWTVSSWLILFTSTHYLDGWCSTEGGKISGKPVVFRSRFGGE